MKHEMTSSRITPPRVAAGCAGPVRGLVRVLIWLGLVLPDPALSDPADEAVGTPSAPPSIEAPVGTATRNIERYRAEIEALVRGAPSFTDSRNRLALPRSFPGDPLAGMAPPAGEAARQNTSTLMVFLTLSMPDGALAGWLDQTARAGGVAVIRGFHGDRLSTTLKRLTALQELAPATKTHGGVSIDPTAFARFGVEVAPTVIVSAAPLPPCATKGCAGDPAPAHDRIAGNITLDYALRLLAADGDQASGVARHHLTRLEATDPDNSGGGGP